MRRRQAAPGFTLVEVTVAMALLAVAATVGHVGLVHTLRAQEQAAGALDELALLHSAIARLDRDFAHIALRGVRSRAGLATAPFVADAEGVEFSTAVLLPEDGDMPTSRLERVRYRLADATVLRERWLVLDRAGDSDPTGRALLEGVSEGRWRYLDEDGRWVERWPDGNDSPFPRAVELELRLEGHGRFRRIWQVGA